MNQKRPYRGGTQPEYLYEFEVAATGKSYTVTKGMWVSVRRRPGLIAGQYEIIYGEYAADGTLLIVADGPLSRERRRKTIRETDIKRVHLRTRPRPPAMDS